LYKQKQLFLGNNYLINRKANFLVVKDEKYVSAMQVAVNSFLSHHSDFEALIHTDEDLLKAVEEVVYRSPFSNRISIQIINNHSDWRITKLKLIIDLAGTNEYYLDVDTRTNGKFPYLKKATFFVDEGPIIDLGNFKKDSLPIMNLNNHKFHMLNTTFFSWGGYNCNNLNEILELFRELENLYKDSNKMRLLEQISLSVFIQKNKIDYDVLKLEDKSFDRGILESSYLGTTGRHIYRR
jgi:hypothetical protein